MVKTRILLADDHAVVREGMRDLLDREKGFEVVGEASDGEEAIRLAIEFRPDVVLMDIVMPGLSGIEATRQIKEAAPRTNVLILTAYSDIRYVVGLLEAGACGYLLKSARRSEIIEAIRAVQSGESVLAPEVTRKLLERAVGAARGQASSGRAEVLSAREHEVLRLAAKGMSNKAIASTLLVSVRTVKAHLTSIFNKLGVGCRTEAITKGFQEGYITLDEVPSGETY